MPKLALSPRVASYALLLSALACVDEPGGQDDEGGSESTGQIDTGDTDTFTGDTETTTADTGTDTATDTGGECLTPVPDDPLIALSFDLWGDLELVPGASWQFEVGQIECCVFWEPLETCSVYSVSPEDAGATIDPDSGLLSIDANTADGTVFTVTADVEDGRFFVTADVFVYIPELHPLKGYWRETGRFPCDNGPEFVPDDPINELVFTASGETRVTWTPFEVYVDYWADYQTDLDTMAISVSGASGNYVPDDIDGEGSFAFDAGDLLLQDMWLGSSQEAMGPAACGHRFEKF